MYTKKASLGARCVLGAVAVACTLSAGTVAAEGQKVVVAIPVNTTGLDPGQPAGARELYVRIEYAAYVACTRGNRAGLAPASDPKACSEKAIADAIRAVNLPLLTQVYLARHSVRDALARGIQVPGEIAAK
jgi:UrcA family protein